MTAALPGKTKAWYWKAHTLPTAHGRTDFSPAETATSALFLTRKKNISTFSSRITEARLRNRALPLREARSLIAGNQEHCKSITAARGMKKELAGRTPPYSPPHRAGRMP